MSFGSLAAIYLVQSVPQGLTWLAWDSSTAGESLLQFRSRLCTVHSDSISTRVRVIKSAVSHLEQKNAGGNRYIDRIAAAAHGNANHKVSRFDELAG